MRVYLKTQDGQWCESFWEDGDIPGDSIQRWADLSGLIMGTTLTPVVIHDNSDPRDGDLVVEPSARVAELSAQITQPILEK